MNAKKKVKVEPPKFVYECEHGFTQWQACAECCADLPPRPQKYTDVDMSKVVITSPKMGRGGK